MGMSKPNFTQGQCPACSALVALDLNAHFTDNTVVPCPQCGRQTRRRALILEALALIEPVTWSLFSSSMYIGDQGKVPFGQGVYYDLQGLSVAKWLHLEVSPSITSGQPYYASVHFTETLAVMITAPMKTGTDETEPDLPDEVDAQWYRFGVHELGAVPAWRQSLFGAASLIQTYPSAAVVLIAAAFESFFLETMRIAWSEKGLEEAAFARLSDRNLPITSLVEWLPPTVGRRSLADVPGTLYQRWKEQVNRRRNDVVHRANVHLSANEAMESLRSALECIAFLDEVALLRPHSYYRTTSATTEEQEYED